MMAFGHQVCAQCKVQRPVSTVKEGICTICRSKAESAIQSEAAIQAKVEAWTPTLHRDLYILARFAWFLRERDDTEQPEPAWRWRELPCWRRERGEPVRYDDDA
jgi:hypothetical protein